jgi:hypothetical protein
MKIRIIISYYSTRSPNELRRLLQQLVAYRDQICVVVNQDSDSVLHELALGVQVLSNPNQGMNIGAWNRGFLENPDSDLYVFLQDECFLKRDGFIQAATERFESDVRLGMLGETINWRWAYPWPVLLGSGLNQITAEHFVDGGPAGRVACYLSTMKNWGVDPGHSAEHLRSLVWFFPGTMLRLLGGFPVGANRGECVAAEIAVSRKIVSLGYRFDQICEPPFSFFGHSEWRSDGLSKLPETG